MTKQEAIELMMQGIKVTHRYFDKGEWMTMRYGKIKLEDGVTCSPELFWFYRNDSSWNEGYELFSTAN